MIPLALTTLAVPTSAVGPAVEPALSVFGGSSAVATNFATSLPTALAMNLPSTLPVAASPTAPFADLVTEAVGQVSQLEQQAHVAVEGLMSGTGVDVHEAMIATEKAEMGFELVLSVRNKALAAYQQVMGMQF